MPIYEYQCPTCGRTADVLLPVSDRDNLAKVPVCNHGAPQACDHTHMTRKVSAPAFSLQGGGWYKDGYTKGGK